MKIKRIIPLLALLLLVLSIGASAASKQTITFQGITMDIPSNWKASSYNDEKHVTYENGDDELTLRDVYDLRKYHETLEEAGAAFKQFAEDNATYEDVSDPVPGKIDGKVDMHTIDCTYHAMLISVFGSGETNYPCKYARVYLGGHDVEIRFVSKKGDFKDFDEAIATARYDEVPIQKETEFDKETAKSEIVELFQPYLDTMNNMENEIIASLEADEEAVERLNSYNIDKDRFAAAFAGKISIEMLAVSATKNFGKIACSLTYPDFEMIEEGLATFSEKYAENNQMVYSSEEEYYQLVGDMIIAFLEDPDFPITKTLFDGNYFNDGNGWELKNEDDIEETIETLCYLASILV